MGVSDISERKILAFPSLFVLQSFMLLLYGLLCCSLFCSYIVIVFLGLLPGAALVSVFAAAFKAISKRQSSIVDVANVRNPTVQGILNIPYMVMNPESYHWHQYNYISLILVRQSSWQRGTKAVLGEAWSYASCCTTEGLLAGFLAEPARFFLKSWLPIEVENPNLSSPKT